MPFLNHQFSALLSRANELVWGPWLLVLILGTGLYLMVRLRFLPLRRLWYALRCACAGDHSAGLEPERGRGTEGSGSADGISPLAALTTELAATIGTGNIVGVATAMVLGGPGALLWMMVGSVCGLALKLAESTLSVRYRIRRPGRAPLGGPMVTLGRAFTGKRVPGKLLAVLYAFFAVMASFGMGNMTQSNSIAEAVRVTFGVPTALTGLLVCVAVILTILGGIDSIARVTRVLVPLMGCFYLLGTFGVIADNHARLGEGLRSIFVMAFTPEAAGGGLLGELTAQLGLTGAQALRYGIARGVFTNEAGLGAGGITAAAADTDDPVRQGYISMTGVFFDTMMICLASGLAYASSGLIGARGADGELLNGTALTIAVFEQTFGAWGSRFVCVSIVLFAFATIIAWAYQGESAFGYLAGERRVPAYRFLYCLIAYAGAVCSLQAVWDFSDICNGLMAVPNLVCVLALSGEVVREIRGRG